MSARTAVAASDPTDAPASTDTRAKCARSTTELDLATGTILAFLYWQSVN